MKINYAKLAVIVFVSALLVFLYGSIYGVFNNDLAAAAATGTPFEHTLGAVLLFVAAAVFFAEILLVTPIKNPIVSWILSAVLLILSIASYCGFWIGVY